MKRTMRSAMAPSATIPATPMAMPAIVNAYWRSSRRTLTGAPLPFEARRERPPRPAADPGVDPGQADEQAEGEAHAQRPVQESAARQDVQHGVHHPEGVVGIQEQ